MNFKVADHRDFHERWETLMHANEVLLSQLHRAWCDPVPLGKQFNEVRAELTELENLIPMSMVVTVEAYAYGDFAAQMSARCIKEAVISPASATTPMQLKVRVSGAVADLEKAITEVTKGVNWDGSLFE